MSRDLLVEIGTEELPPKALSALIGAFQNGVAAGLDEHRLEHGDIVAYASPRRLALRVKGLADKQPDRKVSQKGPPVSVAFDDDGKAKPPALAFAKKCGVDVAELDRTATDKGEWLSFEHFEAGQPMSALIAGVIEKALYAMPIPRRMRWGSGDIEFVRPVHWVVLLYGKDVLAARILGKKTGRRSEGHRFHSKGPIKIGAPDTYLSLLEEKGHVIADMARRRELVVKGVDAEASAVNGRVVDGEVLYDEVTALVEWPVAITGRFEERFLELPREVVVSTLTGHQRYFPVEDPSGKLMPVFITVANLESRDPAQVVDGNERVIRPRLADAAFFWESDKKTRLADRVDALDGVVYQQGLGSLAQKSQRVAALAERLANEVGMDAASVRRAAELCKCDLLTGMVGEFPDLQGIMGGYYAESDGEAEPVCLAIREHYQPRHAGDELPKSGPGQLLAIADRADTLAGAFALGKKPTGNRDPFGLRRAALGIVRILIERNLAIDLDALLDAAIEAQPSRNEASGELRAFVMERLRSFCLDRGASAEAFEAVSAVAPASLPDFHRRIEAVLAFAGMDEAESLAAANKRIGNILRKAGDVAGSVKADLIAEPAEKALYDAMLASSERVTEQLEAGDYETALKSLAVLRDPVDRFFDDVMVMAEDAATRNNRLALLSGLQTLFGGVADISRLSIG